MLAGPDTPPPLWHRCAAWLGAPVQWALVRFVLMLDIAVRSRDLTRSIPALRKRAQRQHAALGAVLLGDFVLVPIITPVVPVTNTTRFVFAGLHVVLLLALAWWYVHRAYRYQALARAHGGRVCIECLFILPEQSSMCVCPACNSGVVIEHNRRLWASDLDPN